jgi:hypothetical protein
MPGVAYRQQPAPLATASVRAAVPQQDCDAAACSGVPQHGSACATLTVGPVPLRPPQQPESSATVVVTAGSPADCLFSIVCALHSVTVARRGGPGPIAYRLS